MPKSTETVSFTLTLPADLAARLREQAEHDYRTAELQGAWYIRLHVMGECGAGIQLKLGPSLLEELQRAYLQAGRPSYREIEIKSGHRISKSAVSYILAGKRAANWQFIEVLVKTFGADVAHFRKLWLESQGYLENEPEAGEGFEPSTSGL